jgi:hypothetical protein
MNNSERNQNYVPSLTLKSNAGDSADVLGWADPSSHRMLVNATITGSIGGGVSAIGDGTATVASAGTAVQLSTVTCTKVIIQAHESNTGTIVIGGATVVAALIGRRGVALFPTQSQAFGVANLNLLYIDGTVSGDKINYYYEN